MNDPVTNAVATDVPKKPITFEGRLKASILSLTRAIDNCPDMELQRKLLKVYKMLVDLR